MTDNYTRIVYNNLEKLYADLPGDLADNLPAKREGDRFTLAAFGKTCTIEPGGIRLEGRDIHPVMGIIVSLYALNANPEPCAGGAFRPFRDFPGSMPYQGAFATHTEQILVPRVDAIGNQAARIREVLSGPDAPVDTPTDAPTDESGGMSGDFSFVVYPLPKIALCYIFYEADEDFPASATCLFSANAGRFLPLDALADTGEYTSKTILELVQNR